MLTRQKSLYSVNHQKTVQTNAALKVGDHLIKQKTKSLRTIWMNTGEFFVGTLYYSIMFATSFQRKLCSNKFFYDQSSPVFISIIEYYLSECNFDFRNTIEQANKGVFQQIKKIQHRT